MRPALPALLLVFSLNYACTSFWVDSCADPGTWVVGADVPRIRSSRVRMRLADPPAAAARFLPYAAMSALAYDEDQDCGHEAKLLPEDRNQLLAILSPPGRDAPKWERHRDTENVPACEDEKSLYYNVWWREGPEIEVVVAFRGTWGLRDWIDGNLHWITRFFVEDQYTRAREHSREIVAYFDELGRKERKPVRYYSTGHSLGGGLAQDVLYADPGHFLQAITFDPSPATGYSDQDGKTLRAACICQGLPAGEARIYRVYESYEILSHLRFAHKLFIPPNRHIQEVRFAFTKSLNSVKQHGMATLALHLRDEAAKMLPSKSAWYAGSGEGCTERFEKAQAESCAKPVAEDPWIPCPG